MPGTCVLVRILFVYPQYANGPSNVQMKNQHNVDYVSLIFVRSSVMYFTSNFAHSVGSRIFLNWKIGQTGKPPGLLKNKA